MAQPINPYGGYQAPAQPTGNIAEVGCISNRTKVLSCTAMVAIGFVGIYAIEPSFGIPFPISHQIIIIITSIIAAVGGVAFVIHGCTRKEFMVAMDGSLVPAPAAYTMNNKVYIAAGLFFLLLFGWSSIYNATLAEWDENGNSLPDDDDDF